MLMRKKTFNAAEFCFKTTFLGNGVLGNHHYKLPWSTANDETIGSLPNCHWLSPTKCIEPPADCALVEFPIW